MDSVLQKTTREMSIRFYSENFSDIAMPANLIMAQILARYSLRSKNLIIESEVAYGKI